MLIILTDALPTINSPIIYLSTVIELHMQPSWPRSRSKIPFNYSHINETKKAYIKAVCVMKVVYLL
jgi:hypothetical protein